MQRPGAKETDCECQERTVVFGTLEEKISLPARIPGSTAWFTNGNQPFMFNGAFMEPSVSYLRLHTLGVAQVQRRVDEPWPLRRSRTISTVLGGRHSSSARDTTRSPTARHCPRSNLLYPRTDSTSNVFYDPDILDCGRWPSALHPPSCGPVGLLAPFAVVPDVRFEQDQRLRSSLVLITNGRHNLDQFMRHCDDS